MAETNAQVRLKFTKSPPLQVSLFPAAEVDIIMKHTTHTQI